VRRGEVWDYKPSHGSSLRLVVLSNDEHNAIGSWPVCAYLGRRRAIEVPHVVPLAEPDPLSGAVDLTTLGTINPARLSGPVGMLTGSTMSRLNDAVRGFLDV